MAIPKASLVHFQPNRKEHQKALKNSEYFELFSNTDLFLQMLEDTDFDHVEDAEPDDFKKYVIEGKLFIGLTTTEYISLDDNNYLFDAFNVYYAPNDWAYYRIHTGLTKAWRKTLINEYPNSTYHAEVRKLLRKELQEIVDQFNEENADLL